MSKNRITIYLNSIQARGLEEMMKEDMGSDNKSAFIVRLIAEEYKDRKGIKEKRGRGRPRKADDEPAEYFEPDYSDDLPKTINHYGKLIGKREMEDIEERTKMHNSMHMDA